MPISSMQDILRSAFAQSRPVAERLGAIKAAHPEIAWYPFRTSDKVTLLQSVTDYFDALPAIPLLAPRPSVLDVGNGGWRPRVPVRGRRLRCRRHR